jgi:mannose-1-phosphate guanylyltransferase
MRILQVIIAGGYGTRLWPLSSVKYPKQFIKAKNGISLLQETLMRNQKLHTTTTVIIVAGEHQSIARAQIDELGIEACLILEYIKKNTAPATIIASLKGKMENYDTIILLPSDHYIRNDEQYINTINLALTYVQKSGLCIIGVKPTCPNTEYGYIKVGKMIDLGIFETEQFIEKPPLLQAQTFLSQNEYFWNSGIIIYNIDHMLEQAKIIQNGLFLHVKKYFDYKYPDQYKCQSQDHVDILQDSAIESVYRSQTGVNLEAAKSNKIGYDLYDKIEDISIDRAILEKISKMILIEASFDWTDLGSWSSLWYDRLKNRYLNDFENLLD